MVVATNGSIFTGIAPWSNTFQYSLDGIEWLQGSWHQSTFWVSIAWNGSVFCAIAQNKNRAATSSDGITWTELDLPSIQDNYNVHISWNGSLFLVYNAQSNKYLTSVNGVDWVVRSTPIRYESIRAVGNSGKALAYSPNGGGYTILSPDGLVWKMTSGDKIYMPGKSTGTVEKWYVKIK